MNQKVIFSFFSGCGILDLGFEKADFEVAFVNEFSKDFLRAYQYARSQMGISPPKYGYANTDINVFLAERKDDLKELVKDEQKKGNTVGFIGGPPCPDFSVAGKQRGKDGDNGKLSLSYTNLIIEMQPDFFLFENVKGLWKTARHREFYEELKTMLQNAGYILTNRLTNALEFGVPQDRDRILMFGIKKDLLVCPQSMDNFPWTKYTKYSIDDVRSMPWPEKTPYVEGSKTVCPDGVDEKLTVEYWFRKNDVYNHPDAKRYFHPRAGITRMQTIDEGDSDKKSYKRIHRWRFSPTVCYGNNEVHLHPYFSRRLSVAEAMSLQSLPKDFCLPPDITLSSCFKTIGNGVPFLLANGIAKTIYFFLEENVK